MNHSGVEDRFWAQITLDPGNSRSILSTYTLTAGRMSSMWDR